MPDGYQKWGFLSTEKSMVLRGSPKKGISQKIKINVPDGYQKWGFLSTEKSMVLRGSPKKGISQ